MNGENNMIKFANAAAPTLDELNALMQSNGGSLDLRGTNITTLPENLTVDGWLDLRGSDILTLPDNLTVGDWMDLSGTNITTLPDNLTVGSWLYLSGTNITTLSDNLTVGGSLNLSGTNITTLPDNLTVGGSLNLQGTNITTLPDNLTVGSWLYLRGTNITTLPDNLTVGGSLNLRGTNITTLPDNLTVGGRLCLSGTGITNKTYTMLKDGAYVPNRYIYADGILTHIKGKGHKRGTYTYYTGRIAGRNVIFDGRNYAHCKDFRTGVADLQYKAAKDRGAEQYKSLCKDSVVKYEDAITMYRIITGACKAGTQHYIEGLCKIKDSYTVAEMIDMTQGQYGGKEFAKFFNEA